MERLVACVSINTSKIGQIGIRLCEVVSKGVSLEMLCLMICHKAGLRVCGWLVV